MANCCATKKEQQKSFTLKKLTCWITRLHLFVLKTKGKLIWPFLRKFYLTTCVLYWLFSQIDWLFSRRRRRRRQLFWARLFETPTTTIENLPHETNKKLHFLYLSTCLPNSPTQPLLPDQNQQKTLPSAWTKSQANITTWAVKPRMFFPDHRWLSTGIELDLSSLRRNLYEANTLSGLDLLPLCCAKNQF